MRDTPSEKILFGLNGISRCGAFTGQCTGAVPLSYDFIWSNSWAAPRPSMMVSTPATNSVKPRSR